MAGQLEHIPSIERLSPAVIRILGQNPGTFTLQGTNTYLLGTGSQRLLVDTGEGKPCWVESLARVLKDEGASISTALITHWHKDHQGGVQQLLAMSPETKIFKNQPGIGVVDTTDHGKLDVEPIHNDQVFKADGVTLTAVHTPGHTADHMCFLFSEEDALFTGDNVLGHGTTVFEDLGVYLKSLHLMKGIFGGRAYATSCFLVVILRVLPRHQRLRLREDPNETKC